VRGAPIHRAAVLPRGQARDGKLASRRRRQTPAFAHRNTGQPGKAALVERHVSVVRERRPRVLAGVLDRLLIRHQSRCHDAAQPRGVRAEERPDVSTATRLGLRLALLRLTRGRAAAARRILR
jgi:hypothetical protein